MAPRAEPQELERYLGNAYLAAVARGESHRAASGAAHRTGTADRGAGETRGPASPPPARLQTKLAVGAAGDALEREAERVADELMQRAAAGAPAPGADRSYDGEEPVRVSRQTAGGLENGTPLPPDIAAQVEQVRGGGMPLPAHERALFEPLLGVDLGSVRIHTGVAAIQTASALNARAYAIGSDIAFASGQYRPGTDSGRRLLAHELVHTVQQRGGVGAVRRDRPSAGKADITPTTETEQQEQPLVPDAASIKKHVEFVSAIENDQWIIYYEKHGEPPPGNPGYLVVTPGGNAYAFVGDEPENTRPKTLRMKSNDLPGYGYYLTFHKGNDTFEYTTRRRFRPVVLRENTIYTPTGKAGSRLKLYRTGGWFEPDDLADLQSFFETVSRLYWIVVPDPPAETVEAEAKRDLPPPWVEEQQRSIKKRLKEAKAKEPRRDTPDRVELWQKKSTGQWWLIVTVNFGAEGQDRSSVPIPLRAGEPPGELMARIKGATQKAYVKHAGQRAEKLSEQAPKWARDLRKALWRALERLRKQEPGKEDFPDQLTLDVARPGEASLQEAGALPPAPVALPRPTPGSDAEAEVYLQVWVHVKAADDRLERLGGTAPWVLQPQMKPDDLVPPVRELARKLRTKERKLTDPQGREGGTATREAFRGEITPLDLPPSGVTVTRANNKFKMDLKYHERYQKQIDLVLANMRTVFFKWEIYDAADIVKADDRLRKRLGSSASWPDRAGKLREHLDANPRAIDALTPVSSPELGRLVDAKGLQRLQQLAPMAGALAAQPSTEDLALYEQRAADPRFVLDDVPRITFVKESRLRFPGAPGDYVVYCEATPEADKEKNAIWAASPAFYPVRTKEPATLGAEVVEMGPNLAKAIDRQIKLIEERLADQSLDPKRRQDLERELRILTEQRGHLAAKEKQDLPATTTSEIGQAVDLLAKLERLRQELPGAIEKAKGKEGARPIEFLSEDLKDVHYLILREGTTVEDKIAEIRPQLAELKSLRTRIGKFADTFKSNSPYRYRPEVAFVSRIDGRVYPLVMMLSEISDAHSAKRAKERAKQAGMPYAAPTVAYSLVDVTAEQTKKEYVGFSWKDRDDPAAHREAVIDAFEDFGEEAVYGEGYLFVRIPPGPAGQRDDHHPGTDKKVSAFHPFDGIKQFESEKGVLEKAIEYLAIIAAVVGVAALVATGVGAPAAAALLGVIAAVMGAGLALHNMRQRARSRTLEWDAALALDVISIIALIPASAGLRLIAQSRNLARSAQALRLSAPAWYQSFDRTQRLLRIYGWLETGATVILLDRKLEDDIQRINAIPGLNDEQRRQLIDQAISNVAQTGLMMLGGWAASQAGGRVRPSYQEEKAKLQQQAELLELEGMTDYPSLLERGWIDVDGYWTAKGRQQIDAVVPGISEKLPMPPSAPAQPKPRQVPEPSTRPPTQPARKRAIAPGAGEPPGGERGPGRRASGEPEPADATQRRREDFEEEDPTGEIERPEIMEIDPARFDMTVIKLSRPARITPKYEFEVFRLFHDTWQKAPDVEIGLYRNSVTGDFIIVVGSDERVYVERTGPGQRDVEPPIGAGHRQRWKDDILEQGGDKGEWINVAHSHPVDPVTKVVADRGRFPSGADDDFGMLVYESRLLGGADRTAQIWFKTPTGPDYTTFSYRPSAKKRIWIEYPDPNTGRRETLEFTDLEAFHAWRGGDPPSQEMLRLEQELAQPAKREGEGSRPPPRGKAPSAPQPPREPGPDVAAKVRDPEDLPGRIERSRGADPDHYFAREYLGDVIRPDDADIPQARYFVEAEFKDGIMEMDFVLRRNDIPGVQGFRRSSQLRGEEEFRRALDYFVEIHGAAGVKGIKGEWGGGDNLDRFNRAFHAELANGLEWNQALERAAFRTHTGEWAQNAKFSEVEVQADSSFNPDKVGFDRLVVIFRRPGASASGIGSGPGPAPPTSGRAPGPASPARQSSAGDVGAVAAPEFARPSAGPGSATRPPPAPRPPRAPPTGPPPPAGTGGGGGGRGASARPGVRPLHPAEATYLQRPGPIWSSGSQYNRSMIFDHGLYREAWQAAAGPQGGEPPPHGYLDHDRREIVIYRPHRPRVNVPVIPRWGATPPAGSMPRRPGRPDVTGRAPTRPYPAQAARDLPARPPSPPAATPTTVRAPARVAPPSPPPPVHPRVIRHQLPEPGQPAPAAPRPAAQDPSLAPAERPAETSGLPPVAPQPEAPPRSPAADEPRIVPGRAPAAEPPGRAARPADVGEGPVRARLRRPEELPLPSGVRDPQEFGEEVVLWGSGIEGADQRITAMQQDPEGYRRHLTRPDRPVTVQMAETWRDHYQNEYERSQELARAYHRPTLINEVAKARAYLMDGIANLLREPPPRPGLIARLRDFVRRRDPGRRTMAGLVQPPVGTRPTRAASEPETPAAPQPPTPGQLRHQVWVDEILRNGLEPGLPEIQFDPQGSLRRGTYRADIETAEEAYQVYLEALARSGGREVQIFRNKVTDRYAVQVGTEFEVHKPFRGAADDWEGVLHYHHDPQGKNVLTFRMPAPADVRAALEDSRAGGGVARTEFVEYPIPGVGRGRVAYTVRRDMRRGTDHITIQYVGPDGKRVIRKFSSLEQYQTEYTGRKFHVDPVHDRDWIEWLENEILKDRS